MKVILDIVVFFFLFLSISVKSQQYDSLVIEDAQWRVAYYYESDPPEMYGWLLRGDTIINGYQYKKVYKRHFQDYYSNIIDNQSLYGIIRENVENKLVYAIQFDQSAGCDTINSEFLLFDFSCQLGDTILTCLTDQVQYAIVNTVDTTFYFGKLRRNFASIYTYHFIEGIGHLSGLFETPIIPVNKDINYYSSELIDYCVGTDEECSVLYVQIDDYSDNSSVIIYPNPCNGSFTIQTQKSSDTPWHYILYNFIGKDIQSGYFSSLNKVIKLDNQGCYYLKLICDENILFAYKIFCIY